MQSRKGEKIDLKNEIFIDQNETWRFQVTTVIGLHIPVVCLLLNLQEIKLPDFPTLQIKMKTIDRTSLGFFLHATEPHEAKYETTPNEHEYYNDHAVIPLHKSSVLVLSQEVTTRKVTERYKCDQSNSHRKSNCIKKYIANYIQCKPPWYSEKDESDMTQPCVDSTKLEEYKNVSFELSTNKTFRFNETDCYKANCKQLLWKMNKMVELPTNAENVTIVTIRVENYVSTYYFKLTQYY